MKGLFTFLLSVFFFVSTCNLFAQGYNTTLIGYFDTPGIAKGVAVQGSYAYVADYFQGLRIINVSDPSNPSEIGAIDPQGTDRAFDVVINGTYAYVAYGNSGLWVFDVSNPTFPTLAGYIESDGFSTGVAISGSYAYVAYGSIGLQIINISDPANPTEAGYYYTVNAANDVALDNNYAYVAANGDGLYIIQNDLLSEVKEISDKSPKNFNLFDNYPNPFNPSTKIKFSVPKTSYVTLNVYTILGKEVATLINEEIIAGTYEVDFNASDLTSGVYFYTMQAGGFTETKKMILIK